MRYQQLQWSVKDFMDHDTLTCVIKDYNPDTGKYERHSISKFREAIQYILHRLGYSFNPRYWLVSEDLSNGSISILSPRKGNLRFKLTLG